MVKNAGGVLLLSLKLDRSSRQALSTQLYAGLRDLILNDGLRAGERLPASRTLASDIGVSRTTVIEAFSRLESEGLVQSRTGAGTYVCDTLSTAEVSDVAPGSETHQTDRAPRLSRAMTKRLPQLIKRLPHERRAFTTAMPAFDAFPMALWSRHVARHWRSHRDVVMGYSDPQGFLPLRAAIASHLRANRAIACEPDQIFIVNGAQHGFQLIGDILVDPGDRVWFEEPGTIGARNCFIAAGADLVPVPVDEQGMVVTEGEKKAPDFGLAFVTPSHQQPLGHMMSLNRRLALLAAAERADAWVVEDDWDGEFCFAAHPPPTLKSIDKAGRVIYVGTFSKTLFPALRLGYVLVPPTLVDVFAKVIGAFSPGVPSNPQAVVADFMDEGHFASHIRRMRRLYNERQEVLLHAAEKQLAGRLDLVRAETGMHALGVLSSDYNELRVQQAASDRGVIVTPLRRFYLEKPDRQGFVLGFSGFVENELVSGVASLDAALSDSLAR